MEFSKYTSLSECRLSRTVFFSCDSGLYVHYNAQVGGGDPKKLIVARGAHIVRQVVCLQRRRGLVFFSLLVPRCFNGPVVEFNYTLSFEQFRRCAPHAFAAILPAESDALSLSLSLLFGVLYALFWLFFERETLRYIYPRDFANVKGNGLTISLSTDASFFAMHVFHFETRKKKFSLCSNDMYTIYFFQG